MKFSYNWLIEYLKKPPAPEKIAELLMLHAFEVEEVKKGITFLARQLEGKRPRFSLVNAFIKTGIVKLIEQDVKVW